MLTCFEDYMTFEELGEYLNYRQFGKGDLSNQEDYYELRNMVIDLCRKHLLRAVFYYEGKITVETYTYINKDEVRCVNNKKHRVKGYFLFTYKQLLQLVTLNEPIFEIESPDYYDGFAIPDIPVIKLYEGSDFISITLKDNLNIPVAKFSNIKFLKSDIDYVIEEVRSNSHIGKPIDSTHAEIEELVNDDNEVQARILELTIQLEEAKTEIASLKKDTLNIDKDSYTTPAINIMNEVITQFWSKYDPTQPAPKQSTITKWITDNFDGISDALALNIDKVCRHSSARSGGKYKR